MDIDCPRAAPIHIGFSLTNLVCRYMIIHNSNKEKHQQSTQIKMRPNWALKLRWRKNTVKYKIIYSNDQQQNSGMLIMWTKVESNL